MKKDTLYYDGACPICRAEIDKLRYFSRESLDLKNIHEIDCDDAALDKQLLLSRLHLKTADGKWVTGLKANIRAWQHTPFRHLWHLLDRPPLSWLSYRFYALWLRHRNRSAR